MNLRRGFTLLEILLAMSILALMGIMVFGSFSSLVESTTAAEKALDKLHISDGVLNQIEESLRSAVFFDSDPKRYTFLFEKGTGKPPDDTLSWVTRSKAFLPADYPTREGLNRVELSVQEVDGVRGLAVRAYSSLLAPESDEAEAVEPWLISRQVKGLELYFYDLSKQKWVDDWELDNQLPVTLALKLYVKGDEANAEMRVHTVEVEIPVGKMSRETRRGSRRVQDK